MDYHSAESVRIGSRLRSFPASLKGLSDNRLRYLAQSKMSGPGQGVAPLPSLEEAKRVLGLDASACMPQATLMDRAAACIRSLLAPLSR